MDIILFIIILAILIFVHEFGHFITAKFFSIRVDKFSIGFSPKIFSKKIGETLYSIGLFPIGGFVKIFGENPDEESINGPDSKRSFINKPKYAQAMVISAGIFFNILLAWLLLSTGFIVGIPTSVDAINDGQELSNISLVITGIIPESPAMMAGLNVGDKILSLSSDNKTILNPTVIETQRFISSSDKNENIEIAFKRGKNTPESIRLATKDGILETPAIGISMDEIGILKLPLITSFIEGGKLTYMFVVQTYTGLVDFFSRLFVGRASLSSVSGPVGIIGIVKTANEFGFVYLLSLVALISINLALINLIPFPALDGGRLFFLLIEKIKGSPIRPTITNALNFIGFLLLLSFMVIITYSDIAKIINT